MVDRATGRVINADVSGVWEQRPTELPPSFEGATVKETVEVGTARLSPHDLAQLLARMRRDWRGVDYDLMRKNCNHFARALCSELGVDGPPEYVNRLANTGRSMADAAASMLGGLLQTGASFLSQALAEAQRAEARASQSGGASRAPPIATGVPVAAAGPAAVVGTRVP